MSDDLNFSVFQLIVENKFFNIEHYDLVLNNFSNILVHKNIRYFIRIERLPKDFLWISIRYGKALPYSQDVFNELKGKTEINPRSPYQTEPNKQLFCIYDSQKLRLYSSNAKLKKFIVHFLSTTLNKAVEIKTISNSIEDFLEKIHYITNISLIKESNLMTLDDNIFSSVSDILGLGKPTDAKIEVNFVQTKVTEIFKDYLYKALNLRQSGEVKKFICIGKDDNNLESIFNLESIQLKIPVPCEQNEYGMIEEEHVKDTIFKRLTI